MARAVRAFAPGRSELAGNHTDHQGGRAIAATLDCGIGIEAEAGGDGRARLSSPGFPAVDVDVSDGAPRDSEKGTTAALVRGVVALLKEAGVPVGGFAAHARSTIPAGGGLSSSAAFELALICAVSGLFVDGDGPVDAPGAKAVLAARVEREYFGKPCGLLDQTAIAYGGVTVMDFAGRDAGACGVPAVSPIDFDLEAAGLALCLVDTHCDHSRYTHEYAQVARDMFDVARFMGASRLADVAEEAFAERIPEARGVLGDLPVLRALHYYNEMALVAEREDALRRGDMRAFLDATRRSAASSAQYLQNVSTADRAAQPAMVALALADRAAGPEGACRIHGGGFGGTIQAFVPADRCGAFARKLDGLLGEGSCRRYRMTGEGARVVGEGQPFGVQRGK